VRARRITCWTCSAYDRASRRCRLGKANPRRKHESLTVAELLGPQTLCLHNPHREPLLFRMHAPPFTPRPRPAPLEVEWLD